MKLLLRRSRNRKAINEIARGGGAVKADPTLTVVATVPVTEPEPEPEPPIANKEKESTKVTKRNIIRGKVIRKKRTRAAKRSKTPTKEESTANAVVVQEDAKPDPIDTEDGAAEPSVTEDKAQENDKGKDVVNSSLLVGTEKGTDSAIIKKKRITKKSKKEKKGRKQKGEEEPSASEAMIQENDKQDTEKESEIEPETAQDQEDDEGMRKSDDQSTPPLVDNGARKITKGTGNKSKKITKSKIAKSNKSTRPEPIDTSAAIATATATVAAASSAASPNNSLASPKSVNTHKVDNRKKKAKSKRKPYDESRRAPSPVLEEDESMQSMWSDVEEEEEAAVDQDQSQLSSWNILNNLIGKEEEAVVDQHQSQRSSWNILNNLLGPGPQTDDDVSKRVNDNVDVVVDTPKGDLEGAWGFLSSLFNQEDDATFDNTALDEASTYDNTVDGGSTFESSIRGGGYSGSCTVDSGARSNGSYTTATSASSALYGAATDSRSATTASERQSFESESFSQSEASSHTGTLESDVSPRVYKKKKKHARKNHRRRRAKNPRPSERTDRQSEAKLARQMARPPRAPSGMKKVKAGFMKAVSRSKTDNPGVDSSQEKEAALDSIEGVDQSKSSSYQNDSTKAKVRSNSPQIILKKVRSNSPQIMLKKVRPSQIDMNIKSAARRSPVPMMMRSRSNKIRGDSPPTITAPESVGTKEPGSVESNHQVEKEESASVEKEEEPSLADTNNAASNGSGDEVYVAKTRVSKSSIKKFSTSRTVKSSPVIGLGDRRGHRSVSPGIFDKMLSLKAARSTTPTPDMSAPEALAPRIVPHQPDETDVVNNSVSDDAELLKEESKPVNEDQPVKTKWTVSEDMGSPSVELSVCGEGRQEESTVHLPSVSEEDREEAPAFPLIMETMSEQQDDPADDISVETADLLKEAQAMLA